MSNGQGILTDLAHAGAVLTDRHFVYTSGLHGTAYINMRAVAQNASWLRMIARQIASEIEHQGIDAVLGPETLGRTLAQFVAAELECVGIWCDMTGADEASRASFSPKLGFDRYAPNGRVAIVDDLLTTGGSIRMAANLVREHGGTPLVGVAVVRRTPDVKAAACGVPVLKVLADVPGFSTFTPEECAEHGPCARRVPMSLRPGHGHEWIQRHSGYPVV